MGPSETEETVESYGTDVGASSGVLSRFREWLVVEGDRVVVAGLLSIVVLGVLLLLHEIGIISFTNPDSVTRVASGMIAGTISLVTLVVSVNQLILSQEFSSAGRARDRFEGVVEFRRDVADDAAVPATPATPTRVLELIVESIRYEAGELADAVADHDREASEAVTRYANDVQEQTERVDEMLEKTALGSFTAVSAAINYDEAWHLYAGTHLRGKYGDSLSDEAIDRLDDLTDSLKLFNVAREQFKTTYLQRELTRFSQLTIYVGVPSILSAIVIGLLYAEFTGPSISVTVLPYVVSVLIVVVLLPLTLLASYILRTATVTRRTASVGPMIPQKEPEEGPFDVTFGEQR